ncbi:MAG TPA: retropepsin-like aspartic protease [Candidatus Paceibacterota bacterium]|nr:retropepsin-like aspartic protease [Candidatus Paceibacterota bacterium]
MRRILGIVAIAAACASGAPAFADGAEIGITFITPADVYTLPVEIGTVNGTKDLNFVLDTGAAYIIAPPKALADVKKEKIGTLPLYLGGHVHYTMIRYRVASFKVGDCELKDIEVDESTASVLPILGQSFLRSVEPYTVGTSANGSTLSFSCPQENDIAAAH